MARVNEIQPHNSFAVGKMKDQTYQGTTKAILSVTNEIMFSDRDLFESPYWLLMAFCPEFWEVVVTYEWYLVSL